MDPEQTFLRVHARVSGMLSQLLTPRIRSALEYVYLCLAVVLFTVLVVMHTNFVHQPGCSSQLSGIEITEAQLVRIKISSAGLWSNNAVHQSITGNVQQDALDEGLKIPDDSGGGGFTFSAAKVFSTWLISGSKRNKLNFKSWKGEKEIIEHQMEAAASNIMPTAVPDGMETKDNSDASDSKGHQFQKADQEPNKTAITYLFSKWQKRLHFFWIKLKQFLPGAAQLWNTAGWDMLASSPKVLLMLKMDHIKSFAGIKSLIKKAIYLPVQWLERSSRAHDPTYLYTTEKGYFLLPEEAKSQHNIHTVNVTISAHSSCFGNRWQQLLINRFVGYDTILMNSLLHSPGPGYLYNFQTKEFYDLSYGPEQMNGPAKFGDYFVTKCSVLLMSLFVFFTTTMSVSFTLRETQSRMLKFTVQLQHHARHRLPTFQLIFVHVIESLVFVPIMIGILFFLFEFYDDQLLAFLVLTLVWLCELFTMISVRTPISMQFFPRFFLLYFLVFHIYFFSYAYGFSYLAFSTTAAFMQHLILFFWNRYEVPALHRFMRNRVHFQQETGVQITSSTILTSTLHIARVNVRNPDIINNELGMELDQRLESDRAENVGEHNVPLQQMTGNSESANGALEMPETNPQQPDSAPASNTLNPFGSFLLWILGGVSTDGIVSFFSLFRDLRDQHNVYVEPPQDGNDPIT